MFHVVDVSNFLRLTHFACRRRLAEVRDVHATPAFVGNPRLSPLPRSLSRYFDHGSSTLVILPLGTERTVSAA
jgi:hypothetical protein